MGTRNRWNRILVFSVGALLGWAAIVTIGTTQAAAQTPPERLHIARLSAIDFFDRHTKCEDPE
jgi:hypothetical protein